MITSTSDIWSDGNYLSSSKQPLVYEATICSKNKMHLCFGVFPVNYFIANYLVTPLINRIFALINQYSSR